MFGIGEFAGIKKGAVADGAAFKMDVRLAGDAHGDHGGVAARAIGLAGLIHRTADGGVAGVEGAFDVGDSVEIFAFGGIKPESATGVATVDDDVIDSDFGHGAEAFGALHGKSPGSKAV